MTRTPAKTGPRSGSGSRGSRLPLALLLVVAFVVKVVVLIELGHHPLLQPHGDLDTAYYVDLARQLADGGPLAVKEPSSSHLSTSTSWP